MTNRFGCAFSSHSQLAIASLVIVTLLSTFGAPAFAQNAGAGSISGTLTDPNGGVIPAAAVSVKNTDTGVERAIGTNEAGIYSAPFLQPGHYEVTASKTGFAKVLRKDLTLQVGQTLTIDIAMPLQQTAESVTVTGEASVVDPEKTEMSQVVSQSQKENLPSAGRRWENFALLTPNVTTDGGSGLVSYRGLSGLYNTSSVDGANNSQAFFSETKGARRFRISTAWTRSRNSRSARAITARNWARRRAEWSTRSRNRATTPCTAICFTTCATLR